MILQSFSELEKTEFLNKQLENASLATGCQKIKNTCCMKIVLLFQDYCLNRIETPRILRVIF